ncbi:MAG TPA: cupin domain-containing protein [Burkholderiales bacterium]|nr:cupin domain-containing protein [Burkholderiales bacterium]
MSANPKAALLTQRPILNVDEVELLPRPPQMRPNGTAAEKFDARMGALGQRLGAKKLGYNVTAIAPGKRAYPFHSHHVNEEMFYVLEGAGEVRIGDASYEIRAGDVIACPAGGKETAHQIVNTGAAELRVLAVSTQLEPDICEYPDSGKFGVLSESFRYLGREDAASGYWDGE